MVSKFAKLVQHCLATTAFLTTIAISHGVVAQEGSLSVPEGKYVVTKSDDRLQVVLNSSKILETTDDIKRSVVHNDSILQLQPISRNQVMISGKITGVTQVDLYDKEDVMRSVQVVVMGDARELEAILRAEFPTANLTVRPIQNSVIIGGTVTSDEHIEQAVTIAEQYYPLVINRIGLVGVHTVVLHTQVLEISRTKLRNLGIDWGLALGDDVVGQSVSGVMTSGTTLAGTGVDTFKYGIVNNGNSFFGFIRALRDQQLVKVMADPTVVAVDGRPASFNSGGEFPILVPAGLGQVGVEFREFGTRLDFVAKVRGDGRIWLDVRPTISEVDQTRTVSLNGITVPGLRTRFVETAVELRAGQTLALAGLLQMRTETQSVGLPGLADLPYAGALFRANREVQNEVELLITVTPDFAAPMDPHEVPPGGPGFNSQSPSDRELYWKGYIEVPNTCPPNQCAPEGYPGGYPAGAPMPPGDMSQPMMSQPMSQPMMMPQAAYRPNAQQPPVNQAMNRPQAARR